VAVELRITGADQLRVLGAQLKAAGEQGQGLRRELLASMRALEKPLTDGVRSSARDMLPHRGGLNEWVAGSDIKFRNNLTGSAARIGARVVATKGSHNLEGIDGGNVRHPVYGGSTWVSQSVRDGWFTKPLNAAAPEVTVMLSIAIRTITSQLETGF
jgi:hypothetical protein